MNAGPVSIESLHVRYGRKRILDRVSLEVPEGAVFALLGRNGAGKSSLVRCLLGQQRAASGACRLFGQDSWRERTSLMRRVGVVPEEPDAPPAVPLGEIVTFAASLYARWDGHGVDAKLAALGLSRRTPFGRLSRGQKAQVSLALALGHAPELLVCDDPTLGLDAVARRHVWEQLIVELADRGTTLFLTTHDLAGVEGIATHLGILAGERLAASGPLEDLKAARGASLEEIFVTMTGGASAAAPAGTLAPQETRS